MAPSVELGDPAIVSLVHGLVRLGDDLVGPVVGNRAPKVEPSPVALKQR